MPCPAGASLAHRRSPASSASSAPAPRVVARPPGLAAPPARRGHRGRQRGLLVVQLGQRGTDPEAGSAATWSAAPPARRRCRGRAARPPGRAAPPARRRCRGRAAPPPGRAAPPARRLARSRQRGHLVGSSAGSAPASRPGRRGHLVGSSASSAPGPRPAARPPGRAAPPARRRHRGREGVATWSCSSGSAAPIPRAGNSATWSGGSASSAPIPKPAARPPGRQLCQLGAWPEAGSAATWSAAPPARRRHRGREGAATWSAAPPARRLARGRQRGHLVVQRRQLGAGIEGRKLRHLVGSSASS